MALDQIDVDKMDEEEGKEMSFLDHIEELRWHLIRSIAAISIGAIAVFLSGELVFDNLIFWPKHESFPTYKLLCWGSAQIGLGESGCFTPPNFDLITTNLEERFLIHLKVSAVLGFVMAFPYVLWEIWRFVSPGLNKDEQKYSRGMVFICSILFFIGISFGYFVISPFAISFFASYFISASVAPTVTLSSFVGSITMFTVPAGVVFELPVVVYFLSKIGLVTPDSMKAYRKHAVIVILLMSAFITPPDVVSQFLIGIPLYVLYEISITISARVLKNAKKREKEFYES